MPKREVTEFDLRAPEFQRADVKPEDYEFRDDGKVVRKDRWEMGLRNIASIIGWSRREYEIPEVVEEVRRLKNKVAPDDVLQQALDALNAATAGLEWYRDHCPDQVNGSDDEANELIGEAIAALEAQLADGVAPSPAPADWPSISADEETVRAAIQTAQLVPNKDMDAYEALARLVTRAHGVTADPTWCPIHEHYKWCEHNGGVMGPNGWQARPPMGVKETHDR